MSEMNQNMNTRGKRKRKYEQEQLVNERKYQQELIVNERKRKFHVMENDEQPLNLKRSDQQESFSYSAGSRSTLHRNPHFAPAGFSLNPHFSPARFPLDPHFSPARFSFNPHYSPAGLGSTSHFAPRGSASSSLFAPVDPINEGLSKPSEGQNAPMVDVNMESESLDASARAGQVDDRLVLIPRRHSVAGTSFAAIGGPPIKPKHVEYREATSTTPDQPVETGRMAAGVFAVGSVVDLSMDLEDE